MKDGPVVAEVPPPHRPVVCRVAINDREFSGTRGLRDSRGWWIRRPCSRSCVGSGAAVDDRCALQVGAADASAIVEHTHVPGFAVSAVTAALGASGHAAVPAASVARVARPAWTACLTWLEAVAVGAAFVAAGAAAVEGWYGS